MAIFSNAVTLTGSAFDDFVLGDSAVTDNTLNGGDGNDYIIGDADAPVTMAVLAGAGISPATAFNLTASTSFWSRLYNPDIVNSTTVSHATAIIDGSTTTQWLSITVIAGATLTLDIDYGDANLGGNTNTTLAIFEINGTTPVSGISTNDNSAAFTDGAGGSNSTNDAFLTYTFATAGTYLIQVRETDGNFEAADSYMLNLSLTGQSPDTPASGNDDLFGGNGNDSMYGIGGNDKLYGGAGNDYMTGDTGNDTLDGGAGNDKVYGGDNNDTFQLTNGFNTVVGDEIYGGTGTDTLDLSALTGLTSVVVNLTTGTFTHSGVNDVNTIVGVENAVGTSGNDSFIGNTLVNAFYGGAGDDMFEGGAGTDKFYGGLGNDTYFTNSSAEIVSEAAGEGTNDVVIASATFALTVGSAVELIQTNNASATVSMSLTGNALAQSIIGNAGNNSLDDGGAGAADTLTGGAGNDTYYVNNAGTLIVEAATFGTNDRVASSVNFVLAADDAIESLTTDQSTGTAAINLTGNALKQSITGNNGNNVLDTGGAAAADTMSGLLGNDTYVVNSAADLIIESAGQGVADKVSVSVSFTLDASDDIEIMDTMNAVGTGSINLTGNLLAQTIIGNAGNNVIDGKAGVDVLTGGAGNDTFSFSTAAAGNIDVVTDYVVANDTVEMSNTIYTGLTVGTLSASLFLSSATGAATTADQRVIYNSTTGALSYDADGNGAGAAVQFATLSAGLAMVAAEINVVGVSGGSGGNIINGDSGNNNLVGTAVADTLYGFAGNDTLTGGLGSDVSFGGIGNDTFVVGGTSDLVTEFAGEGTNDVVQSAGSFALSAGSEVEVIETTNAAGTTTISLTGNALAQSITGNAGINSLNDGGAGLADTLTGLAGNDIYYVANAGTIINEVAGGGTVDRVAASISFTLAADDDVEQMTTNASGGTTAINLTGNLLKQSITGNAGNNILNTGGGAADTMTGLAGNDTYVVRNGGDVIIEGAGQGLADRVNAAVSFVLNANDDIEILATNNASLITAINLTGNALAQTVTGNAGENHLDGKAGVDVLTGGAGNDTFAFSTAFASNIDSVTDYVVANDTIELDNSVFTGLIVGTLTAAEFLSSPSGTATTAAQRIIYNSTTGALSFDADGNGVGAAVQFATLSAGLAMVAGEFSIVGNGGGGASVINGDAGNNNLVGTAAVDTLNGFAGDDTLNGGLGNDINFGGTGNDIYFVEGSTDIVNELVGEGTNDVVRSVGTFVLTAGSEVEVIETRNATLTNAINLTGNALAQSITGNAGINSLGDGGAGAGDTLTGLAGNDIYYVTNATTIINEVAGGGTADRVATSVSFALNADDNIELLSTNASGGIANISLTGNALRQTITGNAGNNLMTSGTGASDTMTGRGGNDTYRVNNSGDQIVEIAGEGSDTVVAFVSFALDASDNIEFMATNNPAGFGAINLTGNGLAQTLTGNEGINILDGKGGNDILIDGAGADHFQFSTALNATTNVDTIVEFNTAADIIALSSAIFGTLSIGFTEFDFISNATGLAETAEQNIIYNSATGALSYDADGLDGAAATQFATLTGAPTVVFSDFIII